MIELLIPIFFIVAVFYSMAGLGGGTSYTALLLLFGVAFETVPKISLACNIAVVSVGSYYFIKSGHFSPRLLLPFLVSSIPMAYFAGTLHIEKKPFLVLAAVSLFLAAVLMLVPYRRNENSSQSAKTVWFWGLPIGAALGGLAGIVGIGGGIFLTPALHLMGWGKPKQIAAASAVFILANSVSGLVGQCVKSLSMELNPAYLWLLVAVVAGGQVGARMGAQGISQLSVRRVSGTLVLLVSVRLFAALV